VQNTVATIDQWAAKPKKDKDWDEAIRIYRIGLKVVDDNHLKSNLERCEKMKPKK
jgi:hypothetical protein